MNGYDARSQRAQDALIEAVREMFERVDPIPESVVEACREASRWRTVDAELAALLHDRVPEQG
jgi:hypothetical protein